MYKNLLARRQELQSKEGGFTLIELLVVVVIIGILVAIAIPLYLHFENGAKTSGAESDVHGLTSLVKLCQSDNEGTLPASVSPGTAPTDGSHLTFSFAEPGCSKDTYNLSANDGYTYNTGTWDSATSTFTAGTGTDFEITVNNSDSGKTATYESGDGQTTTK